MHKELHVQAVGKARALDQLHAPCLEFDKSLLGRPTLGALVGRLLRHPTRTHTNHIATFCHLLVAEFLHPYEVDSSRMPPRQ